nr:uncharacterized protein LOC129283082 [Lytechinus pictus]
MAFRIILAILIVGTSSVAEAGLSDQTFTWIDLSAGVAATVGICVFLVGIAFMINDLGFREYLAEVRPNGRPFVEDLPDVDTPEPIGTVFSPPMSDGNDPSVPEKDDDDFTKPSAAEVGYVNEGELPIVLSY